MNLSRRKFFQVAVAGCGAIAAGGLLAGKAKSTMLVSGPPPCMVDIDMDYVKRSLRRKTWKIKKIPIVFPLPNQKDVFEDIGFAYEATIDRDVRILSGSIELDRPMTDEIANYILAGNTEENVTICFALGGNKYAVLQGTKTRILHPIILGATS